MSPATVHPRLAARRGGRRARTWWGRAWVRAVEEASYDDGDLRAGRTLSRSGLIGHLTVDVGRFVAAVEDPAGGLLQTVSGSVPVLDDAGLAALVEVVAAVPARLDTLLAGGLPHDLVEHAEEAGVELLPFGSELTTTCSCRAWVDPCPHAIGVLLQLAWLVDDDPLVLFALRGLPRDRLLARLHEVTAPVVDPARDDDPDHLLEVDLDTAAEAAARAGALIGDEPAQKS